MLAETEPEVGVDVWAIGYPEGVGLTVTKGIVSGIRDYRAVPATLGGGSQYEPDSRWVQTDCPINHGNSGGPLIDAAGRVVGANTWSISTVQSMNFAICSQHMQSLLEAGRVAPAQGFRAARARDHVVRHVAFIPRVSAANRTSGSQVLAATRAFRRTALCPRCNGRGAIDEKVKVGERVSEGRPVVIRTPLFEWQTRVCPGCSGCHFNHIEKVHWTGYRLLIALAGLDLHDRRADQSLEQVRDVTSKVFGVNPAGLQRILNERAREEFSSLNPEVGVPVMFVGTLAEDKRGTPGGDRELLVLLPELQRVRVIGPDVVDAQVNEPILVGGLLAGLLTLGDQHGSRTTEIIVNHGFVVGARASDYVIHPHQSKP